MWRQASYDPVPSHLNIRVGTTYRAAQDCRVQNFRRGMLGIEPLQCRCGKRFDFASDTATFPFRDGNQAHPSQAAHSRDAASDAVLQSWRRHEMLNRFARAFRNFCFYRGKAVNFLPESHWVAKFALRDCSQPPWLSSKTNGRPPCSIPCSYPSRIAVADSFGLIVRCSSRVASKALVARRTRSIV